ncbi:MAG: hypothetical protein ACKO4T_09575 [Planctomycetaceae bacterium]
MSTILAHRHPAHGLAIPTLLGLAVAAAGCQTPQTATVAPPPTGMIGPPAAYGGWATPSQGAAYPPSISAPQMAAPAMPMPGPATQWQAAAPAPAAPAAAPAGSTWSWSQPSTAAPPSAQQYANQLQNQAQQYANQMQGQTQQYANQMQQYANQQLQQANTQAQGAMNQYTQQMQQAVPQMQQQVTAQMPTAQPATATSWNPFATPAQSLPPARATPTTTVPRY